jgi:hypothetical protein
MPLTTVFRVLLPNRPGEISHLTQSLADAGVNIETGAAVANGREAYFEFLPNDVDTTSNVLREFGAPFQKVRVVLAWIPNQPGQLARALGPLAEAGINIDSLYMVRTEESRILMAVGVSDLDRANQLLSALSPG